MNIITELYNLFQYIVLPLVLSVGLQKGMVSIQFLQLAVLNLKHYRNYIIQLAQYYGGEIRIVAGHGINSVLAKRVSDIIEKKIISILLLINGLCKNLN